jgi:hypothetical protein
MLNRMPPSSLLRLTRPRDPARPYLGLFRRSTDSIGT